MSDLMLDVGLANELKMAFRRHGYSSEEIKKLSEGNFLGQFLLVLRGRAEVVAKSILAFLRTVRIPAQSAITTSEEYFKEAGVVWMDDNFKTQFLGLEVSATEETELAVRKLEEDSFDESILAELGNKAEIYVSQMWAFLNAHRGSPKWFIFYPKGKLWAVGADWDVDDDGWRVFAFSVSGPPLGWLRGRQAVSQNKEHLQTLQIAI